VTVHSRVDGELQQVVYTEGHDVKVGELLAVIDPRPFQSALDQAIGKKAHDEAQLGNAKVVLARDTDLLAKKVIAQQDFDAAKYTVDQFQAAVQADQAAIEAAKTQVDYTQIKSPIDGRTGVRLVEDKEDGRRFHLPRSRAVSGVLRSGSVCRAGCFHGPIAGAQRG
jgi:multidrug efflux system membrane fusion protein